MNFLTDKIRPIYFKYLAAAFGSALITSIYGVVDAAMVGQYQGPTGTAALAVVAPVWNIIYSLGLLTGIGGSVLLSTLRGQAPGNEKRSNEYFTAAVLATAVLSLLSWAALILFDRQLLTLFGAEETVLPLARAYLFPIKFVVPSFLFTQLMSAFLRNDGDPAPTTLDVKARYDKLAEAFGAQNYYVTTPAEFATALTEAIASKKPCLIDQLAADSGKESGHIGYLNPSPLIDIEV